MGEALVEVLASMPLCPLFIELIYGLSHLVQRQLHCSDLYLKQCAHKLTFKVMETLEELNF